MARYQKKPRRRKRKHLTPLTPEEEDRLDYLIANLSDVKDDKITDYLKTPASALALLDRIPPNLPGALDLIFAIGDTFKQKDVQKSLKRAVFRLKQQGISMPDRAEKKESTLLFEGPKTDESTAYLGPVDGTGTRGVLVMLPIIPKGTDIGVGLISSAEGIIQFIVDRTSKKRSREVTEFFFEQIGKPIEVSLDYAATLIEKAKVKSESEKIESSNDYLKLRPRILEKASLLDLPAIYEFIRPEDISGEILTDSRILKLLGHKFMSSWIIHPEKLAPIVEDISKVDESLIIVSGQQKAERVNQIKEKAISELYPDSRRAQLKEDLEEMSYYFFRLGEEEYARICLLAAGAVVEKDSSIRVNPFLKLFLEHSLDYYRERMEQGSEFVDDKERSSPMIIVP